jgi:hypothetical protein
MELRTQKAKGIQALSDATWKVPTFYIAQTFGALILYVREFLNREVSPFCRPCPITPRHGFVDSRCIGSEAEALKLWNEATAADEQAEVCVMHPVSATWSAIVSDNLIALGEGSDGATAGKRTRKIFLAGKLGNLPRNQAGLSGDKGTAAYIEVVGTADHTYAVQLREGVEVKTVLDFVPSPVKVTKIIDPSIYSPLEWEALVPTLPKGSVCYAPTASLTSHAAIHAQSSGVPFVTTYTPAVGQTLKVSAPRTFHGDVMRGLGLPLTVDAEALHSALKVILFALHNSITLPASPSGAFILGVALNWACRLGTAACLGEERHAKRSGLSRSQVYKEALCTFPQSTLRLCKASQTFLTHKWCSGFGGVAWWNCTKAVIDLTNAITAYVRQPSDKALGECKKALNTIVHTSHNGGALLTKFGSTDNFDKAASQNAKTIVGLLPTLRAILDSEAEQVWERERALKVFKREIKPVAILTLQIRTLEGSGQIRIQATAKGHSGYKEATLPVTSELIASLTAAEAMGFATLPSKAGSAALYLPVDCALWSVEVGSGSVSVEEIKESVCALFQN